MLIYVLPLILGLSVCMQSTANGLLASRVGLPLTLLSTSGVVFTCSLAWWLVARSVSVSPIERLAAPWSYYTGGVWGVLILSCAAVSFPRLGASASTVLAIGAQVVAAVLVDHWSATGVRIPLSLPRLLGAALVVVGTALVLGVGTKASAS